LNAAWLEIKNIDAVKTHNPFAINDLAFARKTDFPLEKMNNFGCSPDLGSPAKAHRHARQHRADRGTGAARWRHRPVQRLRRREFSHGGDIAGQGCGAAMMELSSAFSYFEGMCAAGHLSSGDDVKVQLY
jgi:hypothetical protein